MKTLLCALTASLISASSLAQPDPTLLAENGVQPLALSEGKALFRQCSRETPEPTAEVWKPSSSQIQELEKRLPQFIAEREARGQSVPPRSAGYHRQYFGFSRARQKYIYANFFPAYVLGGPTPRGSLVVVCDGGAAFWGVVYNVARGTFESLNFNGPA